MNINLLNVVSYEIIYAHLLITIKGIDILDGTPLLDVKPYIENFDKVLGEVKSGWMRSSAQEVQEKRSDDRFL